MIILDDSDIVSNSSTQNSDT